MNGSHACSSFVLSSSSTKEAGVKSRSMRNSDQESKLKRPEKKSRTHRLRKAKRPNNYPANVKS